MALIRRAFFPGLCFFVLLLVKSNIKIKLAFDEIYSAIDESHFSPSSVAAKAVNSSTAQIIEINRTYPISLSSSNLSLHSRPLCSRDEIRYGTWESVILDAPPYLPRTVHLQCYPESEYKTGQWMHTYEWLPTASSRGNCAFSDWNRHEFCRLMRRATILIIGDSLSFEHYRSLGHLLGIHISQFSQHQSKEEQGNIVNYVCQKQTRIVFRRDDLLLNVSHAIFEEKTFPQVIVMNRGAHYQNDTMLMSGMQKVVTALDNWKSQCEIFNITCHLIWRTSVPGHPNCEKNEVKGPVNNIHAIEALINNRSNYDNRTLKFHWFDYQHQNGMVVDMLKQQHIFSQESLTPFFLEIMDAYYLNVLRPDEHRTHQGDCLHNCYPGKMDVYSQLLLHFLKTQRRQSDIDSLIAWQDNITRVQ